MNRQTVKIKTIAQVDWGNTKLTKSSYVENGQFLAVSAAGADGRINHAEHRAFTPVLSAIGANCGRMFLPDEDFTAIKNTITLTPVETLVRGEYLFHLLESVTLPQRGAGQPFISKGDLENFELSIVDLESQQTVLKMMTEALSQVDELERILDTELNVAESLLSSFRDDCLERATKAIDSSDFGDAGIFVRGPFGGSLKKSVFTDSGYAVYEQQHAISDQCEDFRYFISPEKFKEMERFAVRPSDLIMSCSGTFGRIAIVPEGAPKGIINQALLKISPHKNVDGNYLRHWMRSGHFQATLSDSVSGAALQNVPAVSEMKKFQVKIPDLSVQVRVVQEIEEFEFSWNILIETIQKKGRLLENFRRSISNHILSGGSL